MNKDTGVPPSGSGCQPTASAAEEASSRSGIPNAWSPGPWKIVPYGDGDSLVICEEDDNWRICFMATPGDSPHAWAEIKANARLIASAPQLHNAVAAISKVRDGYASQMKFCDIEALGYFREFVRRIDVALASAMSASGQDAQRLEAKPASAVPKADAQ